MNRSLGIEMIQFSWEHWNFNVSNWNDHDGPTFPNLQPIQSIPTTVNCNHLSSILIGVNIAMNASACQLMGSGFDWTDEIHKMWAHGGHLNW